LGDGFGAEATRDGRELGEMAAICVNSVEISGKLRRGHGRGLIKIAAKPTCEAPGAPGANEAAAKG
jgi:hypothetical protein